MKTETEIVTGDPLFFDLFEEGLAAEIDGDIRRLDWSLGKIDDRDLTSAFSIAFSPTIVVLREPPKDLIERLQGKELGVEFVVFEFQKVNLKGDLISSLEGDNRFHRPGFVKLDERDRLRRVILKLCDVDGLDIDDAGIAEVIIRAPVRQEKFGFTYNLRRLRSELRKVRDISGGSASIRDVRRAMNDWSGGRGDKWELISSLSKGRLEAALRIADNIPEKEVWSFLYLLITQTRLTSRVKSISEGKGLRKAEDVLAEIEERTPYLNWEDDPSKPPSLTGVRNSLKSKGNLMWRETDRILEVCDWAQGHLMLGKKKDANTTLKLLCAKVCGLKK